MAESNLDGFYATHHGWTGWTKAGLERFIKEKGIDEVRKLQRLLDTWIFDIDKTWGRGPSAYRKPEKLEQKHRKQDRIQDLVREILKKRDSTLSSIQGTAAATRTTSAAVSQGLAAMSSALPHPASSTTGLVPPLSRRSVLPAEAAAKASPPKSLSQPSNTHAQVLPTASSGTGPRSPDRSKSAPPTSQPPAAAAKAKLHRLKVYPHRLKITHQ